MAKKPALRKKEEIEAVPLDQPVELDLSDDPIVPIIDDDEDKKPKKPMNGTPVIRQAEPERRPEPEPDNDRAALLKQIEDLKAAEAVRNADWERRISEANQRAKDLEKKSADQEFAGLEARFDGIKNGIEAAEAEIAAASEIRKNSIATGDWGAEQDATAKMMRASARLERFEQDRLSLESEIENRKANPKKDEVPSDPFEAHIANVPSDAAKSWLRNHRDYVIDHRKNVKLQNAVYEVQDKGIALYTPAFFEAVEIQLGMREAPKTEDEETEPEPEPRRTPVSAPVSRDPPSPSTGKVMETRITLSAEERKTARETMPGIDPGEAERIYAREKMKLVQLKKNGHYTER